MEIKLNNAADPTTLLIDSENCSDAFDIGAVVALLKLAGIEHQLRPVTNSIIQLVIPLKKMEQE